MNVVHNKLNEVLKSESEHSGFLWYEIKKTKLVIAVTKLLFLFSTAVSAAASRPLVRLCLSF